MLNTGPGAAQGPSHLGQVLRALGSGLRVCLIRFSGASAGPEQFSLPNRFPELLEIYPSGLEDSAGERITRSRRAWQHAKNVLESREFDLVVLENITDPLREGFLEESEVLAVMLRRAEGQHILATGSDAPRSIVEAADLVTEASEIGV
jgi:cob(I)alamin adenosyltransferase